MTTTPFPFENSTIVIKATSSVKEIEFADLTPLDFYIVTHPLCPPPLIKGGGRAGKRGFASLELSFITLSKTSSVLMTLTSKQANVHFTLLYKGKGEEKKDHHEVHAEHEGFSNSWYVTTYLTKILDGMNRNR